MPSAPMRVHHLDCACIQRLSLGGKQLVCHCLLIETPASGLVLVDTGLGTADYANIASRLGAGFAYFYAHPKRDPSLAAIEQIKALGFNPQDVRHIVQTHLDLDHVGGLSDFPWATVHVHATELNAAQHPTSSKARGRYRPLMWAHHPHFEAYSAEGDEWFGFQAVRQLVGLPDEIFFIPLFGHSLGHCGVAVETGSGWLLHAGDAYFDPREVHAPQRQCSPNVALFQRIVVVDQRQRFYNQDRLRHLIATHPEVTVFSAHDPSGMPSQP